MITYRFPKRTESSSHLKEDSLEWLPSRRERGMIAARRAGSYAEYMVARVLWHLRLEFHYQYRVLHTPYTIDFYIFNGAAWIPLDVRNYSGESTSSQDQLRVRIIENALNRELHTIYDTQTRSFEMALDAVRAIV